MPTDVCESAVLVPVLLWFLWERHEQLVGAHPLQLDLHIHPSSHLRRPGPRHVSRDADGSAGALPDCTELQGDSRRTGAVHLSQYPLTEKESQTWTIGASHAVSGAVVNPAMPNTPVCLQVYVPRMFWITVLDAFYQSLVCFFVPYFVSSFFHTRMYMYFGF